MRIPGAFDRAIFLSLAVLLLVMTAATQTIHAADVTLAWDPVSGVSSYKLYYGTSSRGYTTSLNTGTQTSFTVTGLSSSTYYFAVTAVSSTGESAYSNEVSRTITSTPVLLPTLTSVSATGAITVDGNLGDAMWGQAQSVSFSGGTRSNNLVRALTLWDTSNLYFAFDVTDSSVEAVNGGLWDDDGFEIFLDLANNKSAAMDADDVQIISNVNNLVASYGKSIPAATVLSRTSRTATGYTMEVAIPWSALQFTPAQGTQIGLLLGSNDRDNGVRYSFDWLDVIATGTFKKPNMWGNLALGSGPSASPTNLLPAPVNVTVK